MTRWQAVIVVPGALSARDAALAVLTPVLGRPVVAHVVAAAASAGAAGITVLAGVPPSQRDTLARAVSPWKARVRASRVRHRPTRPGLDGARLRAALRAARGSHVVVLDGTAALLQPETLRQMLAAHGRTRAAATRLVDAARDGRPAAAGSSAWVLERARLARALPRFGASAPDDFVDALVAAGRTVASVAAVDAAEARLVLDARARAAAGRVLRERRVRALLAAGVEIDDPDTTWVGSDVLVAPGARLRPGCLLEGRTTVAAGAEVGPFVRLEDVRLGAGAVVLDHCLLRQCVVEPDAMVGPFAHVRPQSRIRRAAKVGNFVELKKTDLGAGSKAPHLSYLGDATIGARVNVGAGTITCNYDGVNKHKTAVGAGAFVGSNATLIAPLRIGAGAYVAAGSAITFDVPRGALALGRARQVVKPGWARRARKVAAKRRS